MLLSSGLRYHSNKMTAPLTSMFEVVSRSMLENFLQSNAEVHLFSSQNKELPTKILEKIYWLSENIGAPFIGEEEEFFGNIAGDAGLDIVAWHNMGDNLSNRPIYFGQCACSIKDWPSKVYTSGYSHWARTIQLDPAPPVNMMFIPHSYRNRNHKWVKSRELDNAILFDRSRILKYFSDVDLILHNVVIKDALERLVVA